MSRADIYKLISDERHRQNVKFPKATIADPHPGLPSTHDVRLRILVEEVGEVARAIDNLQKAQTAQEQVAPFRNLREELVQVAACAVGWLEAIG